MSARYHTIKGRNNTLSCSIIGATSDEDNTNSWYGKYNPRYNSVSYDKHEMNYIKCGIGVCLFKNGHKY